MKKVIMTLLGMVLFISSLIAIYDGWLEKEKENVYQSLDNVFLEINYAATDYVTNWFSLPNPSIALYSDDLLDIEDMEDRQSLLLNQTNLTENESIFLFVGIEKVFVLHHRTLLEGGTYLHITYAYKDHRLVQSIEVSNSDISLAEALQDYHISKQKGLSVSKEESLQSIYWFSSSKGLPTLQLTDPKEVLEYLKPYGIDAKWIRDKSDYMLYDVVLKRWFENGSQRYSFDNLGNVAVVPLDFRE